MGYKYHVFLSYARVDNERCDPNDPETRWVSTFKQALQRHLNKKLGRNDATNFFFDDQEISGHDPLSGEIQEALKSTAVFVAIGSTGYYHQEAVWCREERAAFLAQLGDEPAAARRVFIIHRDELPREKWQTAFFPDVLGYPFYDKHPDTGDVAVLGEPKLESSTEGYKTYFARLNRLCTDIAGTLEKLALESAARPEPGSPSSPKNPAEPRQRGVVFLAEAAPDLYDQHEELRTWLEQKRFRVVPSALYSRSPEKYRAATQADLAQASLFVQMLGRFPLPPDADLPEGYEALQLACAREAGHEVMRWRPPALELARVPAGHRALLEAPDVRATDLEEFKHEIEAALRRILATPGRSPDHGLTIVGVAVADRDLATHGVDLGDRLSRQNCGFELIPERDSLVDAAASDVFTGFLVAYGLSDPDWVRRRLRECREIVLKRRVGAPPVGIYFCPSPPESKPLLTDLPVFHKIRDAAALDAFLQKLAPRP